MHIPSITNTIENRLLAILSFMLVAHFSVSYTYLISMHFFFVIINGCTHNTWIHVDLIQIDECILSCIIIDVLTKTSNTSVNQIFSSILLESKQMQFIWNASKMRTWHIHFFIHSSILCLCVCVCVAVVCSRYLGFLSNRRETNINGSEHICCCLGIVHIVSLFGYK